MSISELRQVLCSNSAICPPHSLDSRILRLVLALGTEEPGYHACGNYHYEADDNTPAARLNEEVSKGLWDGGWRGLEGGRKGNRLVEGAIPIRHGAVMCSTGSLVVRRYTISRAGR